MVVMTAGTAISVEEYLHTSFRPDCDFVDGEVLERIAGKKKHGRAQTRIAIWFGNRQELLGLEPITELRVQVSSRRVRIPDILLAEIPVPEEEVVSSPPYLCIEIMSPDDTMNGLQDRIDDYLRFGVPNIWVVDPEKQRGWRVSAEGWAVMADAVMRTPDGRLAMPLADVLLP